MSEPASWLAIERGWEVVGSDGAKIGAVDHVVGDSGNDIFNGLVIAEGLFKGKRYAPAERIGQIAEGCVELSVPSTEALPEWDGTPPSEEILPP